MARAKNFIKWWLIWTVLIELFFIVNDPSMLSLSFLFWGFVICLIPSLFIVALKGFYNVGEGRQPWGLRNYKQARPPKHKRKNKKRGVIGSLLNAPHAAAQKGASAVGNMLNFGSGRSSNYSDRKAKKEAADWAAWEEYQEKDRRARERYDKIDEALKDQWDAEHKYADGSFDQYRAQNDANRKFDEAKNL